MLSNIAVLGFTALSLVGASPVLEKRQATTSTATVPVVISSTPSAVSTGGGINVTPVTVTPPSTPVAPVNVTTLSTSRPPNVTTATSTSTAAITSATGVVTGNGSFPLYPCPAGYLLTYVQNNVTFPVPATTVRTAFGSWANSSFFPNITASNGTGVGATHTLTLMGLSIREVLVNSTTNATTGQAFYNWNLSSAAPIAVPGVASISNYSTVLAWADVGLQTNGTRTNTTLVNLFTNFCASSQPAGITVVDALGKLELANLARLVGGNSTVTPPVVSPPVVSSAAPVITSATSALANLTSSRPTVVSSVTSRLANVTSALTAPAGPITSVVSVATALPSSVVSAALPGTSSNLP